MTSNPIHGVVAPIQLPQHERSVGDEAILRMEGGRRLLEGPRPKPPLVSIIMVVLNDRKEMAPVIDSIHAAQDDNVELVVIDGGSHDGTVEFLRERDSQIDYWLSEPDHGIYDAMNRGIEAARGEYILHLNAGDRLKCIPCATLESCLAEGVDVASFAVLMDNEELFHPRTGFMLRIDNTWHHQGTFYRRVRHLRYDTRYRVFGDLDLNQRMLKDGCTVRLSEQVISDHLNNGVSMNRAHYHEVYRSIRTNFGAHYVALAFVWFKYKGLRLRARKLARLFASRFGSVHA